MKTLYHSLIATVGTVTLLAILAPSQASAQACRSQSYNPHRGYYYSSHRPHIRVHRYQAPRRVVRAYVAPRRVVTHSHYGGPIYYRNRSAYSARPTIRYRSSSIVAPRRYSSVYRSSGRRCR